MVSEIGNSTWLSDSILFTRDVLRSNITDPLARTGSGTQFIYTSYPVPQSNKPIIYPIITVRDSNPTMPRRLGMQTEKVVLDLNFEIRVWARNEKEKDSLSQEVFNFLRTNQFGTGSETANVGMHDFTMTSMVNVDEPGEQGIKSKVMEYKYLNING